MKTKFLQNLALVAMVALFAFTSAFASTVSPPGKTQFISISQNHSFVHTASPQVFAVQDSVLNERISGNINPLAGAFTDSTANARSETAQFTPNQIAIRNAEITEARYFSPPDSNRNAFTPIKQLSRKTIDIDRNRHLVQRE